MVHRHPKRLGNGPDAAKCIGLLCGKFQDQALVFLGQAIVLLQMEIITHGVQGKAGTLRGAMLQGDNGAAHTGDKIEFVSSRNIESGQQFGVKRELKLNLFTGCIG